MVGAFCWGDAAEASPHFDFRGKSCHGSIVPGGMHIENVVVSTLSKIRKTRSFTSSRRKLSPGRIQEFALHIFGESMHAKRVMSLGNAVIGLIHAAVASIHAIGAAYAATAGILPQSGVKQIDRLLSNANVLTRYIQQKWVQFVVAERPELLLAMDWTEFDDDDHSTLAVYVITDHGRATPLAWRTHQKSRLKDHQKEYEHEMIACLREWLAPKTRVTLLADRGFGDQKLYKVLMEFGWDFVIRFRGNIKVTGLMGASMDASKWVPFTGRAKLLSGVRVTRDMFPVPAVVTCWDKKMKEPWCLATTLSKCSATSIVKKYGRRFTIEETFRDQKNSRFGMGLKATHIRSADRRDRLLLVTAIAHSLMTLLGAAAERCGMDSYVKVNTVKRRTRSLYRQGLYWYAAMPNMPHERLVPLMRSFAQVIREHENICEILGVL